MEEGRHSQIHQCGRNCGTILRYPNYRHLVTHSDERAVVCWWVLLDSYPPVKRQADGINAETCLCVKCRSAPKSVNLQCTSIPKSVNLRTKVGAGPLFYYRNCGGRPSLVRRKMPHTWVGGNLWWCCDDIMKQNVPPLPFLIQKNFLFGLFLVTLRPYNLRMTKERNIYVEIQWSNKGTDASNGAFDSPGI